MRAITAAAVALVAAAACGKKTGASGAGAIKRLAHELPATARAVFAIDGARLAGTWLESSVRAFRALIPPDRGCLADVALAADRALVAELATGRIVAIATRARVDCAALSRIGDDLWLATLDGATAPGARDPRLDARPDFAEIAARLDAPVAAVAPDGVPEAGVVFAAARFTPPAAGALSIELDTAARASAADAWLHEQLAASKAVLGTASPIVDAITVARAGTAVTVTLAADPAVATRDGPVAVVAVVGALAARRRPVALAPPGCVATHWPVTCHEGVEFEVPASERTTVETALREAHPAPRVEGGRPAGVRLGELPEDGILVALGLRTGDAVIAANGRQLDTRDAIDELAARLRTVDKVAITVERGGATIELHYAVTK